MFDVINKVGIGGNFLLENHTLKYMKSEYWKPNIFNRDSFTVVLGIREKLRHWPIDRRLFSHRCLCAADRLRQFHEPLHGPSDWPSQGNRDEQGDGSIPEPSRRPILRRGDGDDFFGLDDFHLPDPPPSSRLQSRFRQSAFGGRSLPGKLPLWPSCGRFSHGGRIGKLPGLVSFNFTTRPCVEGPDKCWLEARPASQVVYGRPVRPFPRSYDRDVRGLSAA